MLADLSTRTKLRLSGSDRERYLNGQVTNDVRELGPGSPALYACVTNAKGGLEADVFITALPDAYLIDADASLRESLQARLEKYVIADDVAIEDVTDAFALYHLVGNPAAAGQEVPGAIVSPASRFGPPGVDFLLSSAADLPGTLGLPIASEDELERLRIAHAIPKWGAELTPGLLPPEARLEKSAISYTKGCYIGQEVISRIANAGKVNRLLVTITPADPAAPFRPGQKLYTEKSDKPLAIGVLTSCSTSPAIGLAYVKSAHAAPGTTLFAGTEEAPLTTAVEISKSPLILQ